LAGLADICTTASRNPAGCDFSVNLEFSLEIFFRRSQFADEYHGYFRQQAGSYLSSPVQLGRKK
jgi:hypothetical protein